MLAPSVFQAGVPSPVRRARGQGLTGHRDRDATSSEHHGAGPHQVDDAGRQGGGHERAAGADRRLGQRPLVLGPVPLTGRHAPQIPLQAQRLVGVAVERAAGLQPVVHRLLAGEDGFARGRRPGPAGRRRAQLDQLAVAFGVHGVGRFPFGRDLAAVLGQLVGGQVALLGGGAGQDVVGRGPGRGPLLAQLVEQVGHRCSSSIPTKLVGNDTPDAVGRETAASSSVSARPVLSSRGCWMEPSKTTSKTERATIVTRKEVRHDRVPPQDRTRHNSRRSSSAPPSPAPCLASGGYCLGPLVDVRLRRVRRWTRTFVRAVPRIFRALRGL
jgi:hypothetical protein